MFYIFGGNYPFNTVFIQHLHISDKALSKCISTNLIMFSFNSEGFCICLALSGLMWCTGSNVWYCRLERSLLCTSGRLGKFIWAGSRDIVITRCFCPHRASAWHCGGSIRHRLDCTDMCKWLQRSATTR